MKSKTLCEIVIVLSAFLLSNGCTNAPQKDDLKPHLSIKRITDSSDYFYNASGDRGVLRYLVKLQTPNGEEYQFITNGNASVHEAYFLKGKETKEIPAKQGQLILDAYWESTKQKSPAKETF